MTFSGVGGKDAAANETHERRNEILDNLMLKVCACENRSDRCRDPEGILKGEQYE